VLLDVTQCKCNLALLKKLNSTTVCWFKGMKDSQNDGGKKKKTMSKKVRCSNQKRQAETPTTNLSMRRFGFDQKKKKRKVEREKREKQKAQK
jgi:hypothetical protein